MWKLGDKQRPEFLELFAYITVEIPQNQWTVNEWNVKSMKCKVANPVEPKTPELAVQSLMQWI